jgi:hypothetical protein
MDKDEGTLIAHFHLKVNQVHQGVNNCPCRPRFEPPLEETKHESTTEIEAQHGGRSVYSHFLSGKVYLEQI